MISNFFKKLKRIFYITTLRDRIFYTFTMFLVVRTGSHIPLPGIDLVKLKSISSSGIADFVNLVSGGAFARASIFALSIIPYINASIIIYVLTLIYPKLDEMQKEGGKEKEKLTQWTRYLAVGISILHSVLTVIFLRSRGLVESFDINFLLTTILLLTSSVIFLTWIGDQISSNGIGNGISLIIFLGIVSRLPAFAIQVMRSDNNLFTILILGVLTLAIIAIVVAFQTAVRKIVVYYASGKTKSQSAKSYLPIRINNAGVMPIIFASVVASFPASLLSYVPDGYWLKGLARFFTYQHPFFLTIYFFAILFFTFFYTSVVFDPNKISDNLKKSGASLPGVRPGAETVDYLEQVITRITFGGSLFLAIIAVLPYILGMFNPSFSGIGGTGILIAVSVAIDTVQQIEGALSMEEYQNFI